MAQIKRGDKFVACWGYDQTQYSIYNVVDVKGHFVLVEGMNGWSDLDANDLAVGSKVKVYQKRNERFYSLTEEQRQAIADEFNFNLRPNDFQDFESMMRWHNEKLLADAPVRTIVQMNRVNGNKYSYKWVLDNGQIVDSTEDWQTRPTVEIIRGIKRCLVNEKYGTPSIKIDECITAHLDTEYGQNSQRYTEQNEYTAYNGR